MSLVDWTALVLLWGVALLRLSAAWRSRQHRPIWGAFFWLAVSRLFSAEPVVAWLDVSTRMEWATLCRHLSGLASATCLLAYVEMISRRGRASWVYWIWPPAVIVMAALPLMFVVRGGRIYWVDGAYAPGPTSTAGRFYLTVFSLWLMYCLGMAVRMSIGYVRTAPPLLCLGLVLSTIGMVAGVLNRGYVTVVNLINLLRPRADVREWALFNRTTFLLCVVGITAGTSIPAWRAASTAIYQASALHELRPLWEALIRRYPDIALDLDGSLRVRLYRRVLEIRDGMLSLTSVTPSPVSEDPREVAAWVASALQTSHVEQGRGMPSGIIPGPDLADDIERETKWLRQVAAAYKQVAKEKTVSPVD